MPFIGTGLIKYPDNANALQAPMPAFGAQVVDPQTGQFTAVAHQLITALWTRTGQGPGINASNSGGLAAGALQRSGGTMTGTLIGVDGGEWTTLGISGIKSLGVGRGTPALGDIDIAGQYEVNGIPLSVVNLSNGFTGTGEIVLQTSPVILGLTNNGNLINNGEVQISIANGNIGLSVIETTDTSWTAFGNPGIIAAVHGNQNSVVGYVLNDLASSSFALPAGVIGYGKVSTNGNQIFGLYGLGELVASGGGVAIACEITSRNNSGNAPDTNLPPNVSIGTLTSVTNALQVTCGGSNDSSIGIWVNHEGGSSRKFSTGMYFGQNSLINYGIYIDTQSGLINQIEGTNFFIDNGGQYNQTASQSVNNTITVTGGSSEAQTNYINSTNTRSCAIGNNSFNAIIWQSGVGGIGFSTGGSTGFAGGTIRGDYGITTPSIWTFSSDVTITGVPSGPTAAPGTNTTQLATTAYALAAAGGGVTPSALTKTNDTNVTLTLGGTPTTALLQATSLTLGWTGILASTRGGTANGFFTVAGPATSTKTFTFPNASANVLTDNAAVTVAQGGTGLATLTAHAVLLGEGTGNMAFATIGTGGRLLLDQGAGVDPSFNSMSGDATITSSGVISVNALHSGAFANPSASIGLTAVNGAATTAIRSDGAPALSQAITPTWTNLHTFSAGLSSVGVNNTGVFNSILNSQSVPAATNGLSIIWNYSNGGGGAQEVSYFNTSNSPSFSHIFYQKTGASTAKQLFSITSTSIIAGVPSIISPGYTVATLPTGSTGMQAYVTDALGPTFGAIVVGGGAITVPVFYNGANWIVG